MQYIGDFPESATVNIFFTTSDGSGGAVAPSTAFENADIEIYKDNSATQRASDAGVTMTSPFDSTTGLHHVSIDTSDDTDVGFYATGSDYTVILAPDETVDGQTVVKVLAQFSIENRTTYPKADMPTNFADLSVTASTGRVDVASIEGSDATDQIRDAVVDDATRIDASALNTASAAVGSDGTGLTEAGGTGDHLTAVPWNAAWDAEVQSEVQDAIEVNHLDHLFAADYDPSSKPGTATALLNELVENDGGVSRFTTNALEQAPTGGSAPTAAAIADAVWDEATSGHTSAGTFGEQCKTDIDAILADTNELQTDNIPGTLTTIEGKIDTIDGIVDSILVDTGTTIPAQIDGLNDPTAADVATAVMADTTVGGVAFSTVLEDAMAMLAGETTGHDPDATGTVVFEAYRNAGTDQLAITYDADQNRTLINHSP